MQGDLTLTFSFDDKGSVEVKRVIKDVEESLRDSGKGASEASRGFDTMRGSVERSVSGFEKFKSVTAQGVQSLQAFGIAWTVFGGFAFMAGKKVDDALDSIRGRTGLTGAALASLQQSFKNVATTVPQDMRATAQVMITLTQLTGLAGKDLEELATKALKMASVLGVDAVSSVETLTKTMIKWNLPMKEAPALMDYLLKVSQTTGVSMGQLTGTMQYTASTMQELGLSFKQGAALIGSLEKAGVNSTMMFMMLRNTLKSAAKDGESMSAVFKKVVDEIKNTTDETRANTLAAQYFGRTWMDAKKAIQEGRFEVEGLVRALDASTESVDKAYEDTRSFAEIWAELKNKLIMALEPLGKQLMLLGEKYLPKIIGYIEKWSAGFDKMSTSGKGTVAVILAIGGPLGIWLNIFVKVLESAGKLGTMLAGLVGFIGPTGLLVTGTYMAGYNLGKWLDTLPVVHKWAAMIGDMLAVQLGYYENMRAIDAGMMAGTQDAAARGAKNMLFLSTASELAGKKITDVMVAEKLLRKQYIETGTTGVKALDEWAQGCSIAEERTKKLIGAMSGPELAAMKKQYEDFRTLLTSIPKEAGGFLQKLLGDSPAALFILKQINDALKIFTILLPPLEKEVKSSASSSNKWKEDLKALGGVLQSDIEAQLKKTEAALKKYGDANLLTKSSLEALKDTVIKYKIELGTASDAEKAWYLLRTSYGVKSFEDSAKSVNDLIIVYKDLEERYRVGLVSIGDYQKAHETLTAALNAEGIMVQTLDMSFRKAPAKFDTSWGTEGIGMWQGLIAQIEKYKAVYDLLGRTGGQTMAMASKQVQFLTKDFLALSFAAATPATMAAQWGAIKGVFANMGLSAKEAETATVSYLDALYKTYQQLMLLQGITLPDIDWSKIIKGAEAAGAKAVSGLQKGLQAASGTLGMLFGGLATQMSDSFGELPTIAQQNAVAIVSGFGSAFEGLSAMFAGLPVGAKASFDQIATAITPALGAIGGAIGGLISGTKKNFAQMGADIGSTIGGIFGPLGKMVGGFLGGVLGGLFKKSKTDMEKWADEGASAFAKFGEAGKKVSDELNKKFAELRKEGFAATAAEAILLSDVMNEMGVNTGNIEKYWGESLNAISQVTAGLLTQEKANEALGKDWDTLIAKAIEFGTEGSAGMTKFILETRKAGMEIPAMTDYINDQLGVVKAGATNAAQGLTAMAGAVKTASDLTGLKEQTLAVFNAMIANGVSAADAVSSLGSVLDAIAAKEKELGIAGGGATAELMKIRTVAEAHKGLFDAVSGNLAVLTALGNTGSLTQDSLTNSANAMQSYYTQLQSAGLSGSQALAQIAPTLEKLNYLSAEQGLALDDNTKKLIAEASAQGLLGNASIDTNTVMMAGFGEIIKALGGEIPAAFQKSMDTMAGMASNTSGITTPLTTAADTVSQKFTELGTTSIPTTGFDGMIGEIGKIPPELQKAMEEMTGISSQPIPSNIADGMLGEIDKLSPEMKKALDTMKKVGAGAEGAVGAPVIKAIRGIDKVIQGELTPELMKGLDSMKKVGDDADTVMGNPVIKVIDSMGSALEEFRKSVTGGDWTIPIDSSGGENGGKGKGKGGEPAARGFEGYLPTNRTFTAHAGEFMKIWPASQVRSGQPVARESDNINVVIEPIVLTKDNEYVINFVTKKIERGGVRVPVGSVRGNA